jgi:hypothetical protein
MAHGEGGIGGALRMIFAGDWRAEHRQETFARGFEDCPFIALNGRPEKFDATLHNLLGFFGIRAFAEGEIDKKNCQ